MKSAAMQCTRMCIVNILVNIIYSILTTSSLTLPDDYVNLLL